MPLVSPGTVQAQAARPVEFVETRAEADFPRSLTFHLMADVETNIESVQLFWRPAGSTLLTLAEPPFEPGPHIDASHQVDMTIDHLPPGLDIEYFWRLIDDAGNVHESDSETFFYMDQRFDWETLQAGLVSIWWYEGSREFAEDVASAATDTLLLLDSEFGLKTTEPIRIIVYAGDRDFAGALRPNSAEWIGGVAYSAWSHIVANIRPDGNAGREIDRMIPHEISHVVVHQASKNPYNSPPPWLDEGLATFVQGVADGRLAPTLQRAVDDGQLIPVGALKSSFPVDPGDALLSYAESVSVVSFLVETQGRNAVGELVTAYRREMSHDQVVYDVLGLTMDELDAEWKAWLNYAGDRPESSSEIGVRGDLASIIWFLGIIGLVLAIVSTFVFLLFWRTRTYATETVDETTAQLPPE